MADKKRKILYCITKGNWGGAQRYVYDLATSLPNEKYDVSVLFGTDGALAQKLKNQGIRTIILRNLVKEISLFKDLITLFKLVKIFKEEKPDIIHLNSSKMSLLGSIAGRLTHVPKIIFTGHGWAFNEDRGHLQRKIIFWLHKLTIRLCHITIAVSAETKKQISSGTPIDNKIIVLKNGIDNQNFLEKINARNELMKKLPADLSLEKRLWLGTISELHKNKGLKYIIEAMHLLETESDNTDDLPILIIIGEGDIREKLQQRINRYGLEKIVFLVGRVEEAAKYLKAFDIFTLTSITEALPYVILEAGQAGLPIIASYVGGIPEIIDDIKNGILVRPREPEEIQKAINFLLSNPEKMPILSHNIQEKIIKDFNKEKMIRETLALY